MTPLNPYFLQGSSSEQRLLQDLVNEHLTIYGQDVLYLPRKILNEKKIIREAIFSKFDDSYRIEAYIENVQGYSDNSDILSKFGVRSTDEITFIISKERYEDFIVPKLKVFRGENIKLKTRPAEGDLIYLPLDDSLFEIKYVQFKKPYYQLNQLYVYELRCELFEYEDEIIDTDIDEVDRNVQDFGYIATIHMVGAAASAASLSVGFATSLIPSPYGKSVSRIDITNGGSGYLTAPKIRIQGPVGGGLTATAVAKIKNKKIDKIYITNPGIGYTTSPIVVIEGGEGRGGIATAIISNGVLTQPTIVSGGFGYSSPPIIEIGPPINPLSVDPIPPENIAKAEAFINSSGVVTSIRFTNAGTNYVSIPPITLTSPVGISTGDYEFNEVIRGVSTGTSAYVKEWDYDRRILKVSIANGHFAIGEAVVGAAASYKILSINSDNIYDPYAQNDIIEQEADSIIDFSETNPFGDF
jgi:hypothetical protein